MSFQHLTKLKWCISMPKIFRISQMTFATSVKTTEEQAAENKPAKFINSEAYKWKAEYSRRGTKETRLWYEPYVISGSLAIFLIYFCVLREESDIDLEFGRSLYSRISGLEEVQLRLSYNYNKENGLDVADIERRLQELQKSNKT